MSDRLADVATLEGLRGLLRMETDPALLRTARETVSALSILDPRRICCRCYADLGPAQTKGDTHGYCGCCLEYESEQLDEKLLPDALSAA